LEILKTINLSLLQGKIARKYAAALNSLGNKKTDDSDWLGIYSIRLNCLLLSLAFKDLKNITVMQSTTAKPGQSSDFHAVEYAKKFKAKTVINLSNIDYVYDKNPNEHKDAKPLKNVSWKEFLKIVGTKWEANKSWPFDPTASRQAEKLGLKVVFMNGTPLNNLSKYLKGENFIGTEIN
jgi:uridylate kinase